MTGVFEFLKNCNLFQKKNMKLFAAANYSVLVGRVVRLSWCRELCNVTSTAEKR